MTLDPITNVIGRLNGLGQNSRYRPGLRRFRNNLAPAIRLVRVGLPVHHVQPSNAAGDRPADGIRLTVAP